MYKELPDDAQRRHSITVRAYILPGLVLILTSYMLSNFQVHTYHILTRIKKPNITWCSLPKILGFETRSLIFLCLPQIFTLLRNFVYHIFLRRDFIKTSVNSDSFSQGHTSLRIQRLSSSQHSKNLLRPNYNKALYVRLFIRFSKKVQLGQMDIKF